MYNNVRFAVVYYNNAYYCSHDTNKYIYTYYRIIMYVYGVTALQDSTRRTVFRRTSYCYANTTYIRVRVHPFRPETVKHYARFRGKDDACRTGGPESNRPCTFAIIIIIIYIGMIIRALYSETEIESIYRTSR